MYSEHWKDVRTKTSYEQEIAELKTQIDCFEALAADREKLIVRNKKLAKELVQNTEKLEKNCRLFRARIKELLSANAALREENEYLQKIVNAAAKLGEPFMKAVFENMEV